MSYLWKTIYLYRRFQSIGVFCPVRNFWIIYFMFMFFLCFFFLFTWIMWFNDIKIFFNSLIMWYLLEIFHHIMSGTNPGLIKYGHYRSIQHCSRLIYQTKLCITSLVTTKALHQTGNTGGLEVWYGSLIKTNNNNAN